MVATPPVRDLGSRILDPGQRTEAATPRIVDLGQHPGFPLRPQPSASATSLGSR